MSDPVSTITIHAAESCALGAAPVFSAVKDIGVTSVIRLDDNVPIAAPITPGFAIADLSKLKYIYIKNEGPESLNIDTIPAGTFVGGIDLAAGHVIEAEGVAAEQLMEAWTGDTKITGFTLTSAGPGDAHVKALAGLLV